MNLFYILLGATKYLSIVSAALYNHNEALGMACALAAQGLFTTCAQEDHACFCASSLYIYAVENCITRESKSNSTTMALAFEKFEQRFCEAHNSRANTTNVWSAENQSVNPTVSQKAYKLAYDGEKNNLSQKHVAVWLGIGMILYWVVIASCATSSRVIKKIASRLFAHRMVMRRAPKYERWLQKYIIWPAMFKHRHMDRINVLWGYIKFSLPTRLEGIVVSVYIILAIIFMLTPYTLMNNDPLFPSRWKELMRYSSDRAGIIATIQFPLLILFAIRNNILIWLTGWSYATYNTYHRAIARITYLLLVIHAIIKHIFSLSYGGSMTKYYYPLPYFRWGCAAIGLFSLMIMMAMFRSKGYEIFYRFHQLMAIGGLICSIFHLNGLGFKTPLWISIAFWGADWTLRVFQILLFNVNFVFPPLPGARRHSFAFARLYPDSLIKLTITTPVRWVCRPGQYVYLHTNLWNFIGGHPFSVIGESETGDGLELVIATRKGMTARLHAALERSCCSPHYPVTIPVYIEGPYGNTVKVECYDEGLFFAGGIGITGVLGYIEKMSQSSEYSRFPKKITLFWSIRHRTHIDPVACRLAKLGSDNDVQIRIFQVQKVIAPVSPEIPRTSHSLDLADRLSHYDEQENDEKFIRIVDLDHGKSLYSESEQIVTISPTTVSFSDEQTKTNYQRASDTAPSSLHSKKIHHKHAKSGTSHHTQQKSIDMRKSFMDRIKAGATDKDDENDFDYGLDEFEESELKNSENPDQCTTANVRIHKGNKSVEYGTANRQRCSEFIAAGFTDDIAVRTFPSSYPFDDDLQNTFNSPIDMKPVIDENHQLQDADLQKFIEPVRMNIPELLKYYLMNSDGSVCVLGCGPDKMIDTLRWSCCKLVDYAKNGRVDYFEEAFSY